MNSLKALCVVVFSIFAITSVISCGMPHGKIDLTHKVYNLDAMLFAHNSYTPAPQVDFLFIKLQNKGDYIARYQIRYTIPGYSPNVKTFANKRFNWIRNVKIPVNATEIKVSAWIKTDFPRDKEKRVLHDLPVVLSQIKTPTVKLVGTYKYPAKG